MNGRRVMVTGAGDGIGREVASAVARAGAGVSAFSLEGHLETLGSGIRSLGRRCVSYVGDIVGRFAEPSEVAAAVLYLASNAAATVNGHVLRIDGGATMH